MSLKAINSYAKEVGEAFKTPIQTDITSNHLIVWRFPCGGEIKLNTDGCWYDSNNKPEFRGVFRNDAGAWILGFYGKLECNSSLEAELWAMYIGLTIILEKGLQHVKI